MDTYQSYPEFVPRDDSPVDNNEYEEITNTKNEEPIPQSAVNSKEDEEEEEVSNNLLNVQELDSQYFQPRPIAQSTLRAAVTTTVTRTYTRTYTRTSIPTTVNNNNNNNNNINRIPNNNINRSPNTNTYNNNNNQNNNNNRNVNINNNNNSPSQQNTKTIPSQLNNNRNTGSSNANSIVNNRSNVQSQSSAPGSMSGIGKNGLGSIPEDNAVPENSAVPQSSAVGQDSLIPQNNVPSNLDATIVPEGASTGFRTGNTIDQDINQIQTNSDNGQKQGTNFTFIIVLIAIPIVIIITIASIYYVKKYKNEKFEYPEDKIKRPNLFGTIQFFNPKKPNRVSVSSGSRGSRGSRTNLTSLSNDRESNVPEYSEWLEAGSNTLSMPPVSPPPIDNKMNGLNGSNFGMGGNLDNHNNNGTLTSVQINKPQAARMAWKLEGMRVGRDSTRKSGRQSLFNSFQVW